MSRQAYVRKMSYLEFFQTTSCQEIFLSRREKFFLTRIFFSVPKKYLSGNLPIISRPENVIWKIPDVFLK